MKKSLVTLLCALSVAPLVHAEDIALLKIITVPKQPPQTVAIEFYEAEAPATVANFKKLAGKKFYDGVAIHRAFPHILLQTGDPLSRKKDRTKVGTGGPGWTVQPEIRRKHLKGAVAMARLPDKINPSRVSNGSQFYICLQPYPSYDGQYTVFGHVLQGLDVLDAISTKSVDSNDNPVERVVIESVRIIPREQLPSPEAPVKPGAAPAKKSWWKFWG